jgi:hypothetical protein
LCTRERKAEKKKKKKKTGAKKIGLAATTKYCRTGLERRDGVCDSIRLEAWRRQSASKQDVFAML